MLVVVHSFDSWVNKMSEQKLQNGDITFLYLKYFQCPLDITLSGKREATFTLEGSGPVHISGNYLRGKRLLNSIVFELKTIW